MASFHQHHHIIPNLLHWLAAGALGASVASLAARFGVRDADRMPGESLMPACLYCLKSYSWQNLTPLFGWILRPDTLSFPCPCGQRRGEIAMPVIEIAGIVIGITAMVLGGWGPWDIPMIAGLTLLPAIAWVDLQYGIIPDALNLLLGILGAFWVWTSGGDFDIALLTAGGLLLTGLFFAVVYSHWRGREMLGIGDVKFFAAAGLWLLPEQVPWFLGMAGILGIGLSFGWRRAGGGKEFPFAPALCVSLIVCIFYQILTTP